MAIAHPSGQLHELVWTALKTFDEHPDSDQDDILTALVDDAGLLPEAAWALYQFAPAAVTHTVLRSQGVNFPSHFLDVIDLDDIDRAKRRAWTSEPLYVSAVEVVEHLLEQGVDRCFLARCAAHCAEMNVFGQLADEGCDPADIVFTETLVMSYSALEQTAFDEDM